MAETTYTYSISQDIVAGVVDPTRLSHEIDDSSISTALARIDTSGDTLDVSFSDSLSAGDKTTLDGDTSAPAGGIIGSHSGIPWPQYRSVSYYAPFEPVDSGVVKVVANGRPAVEVEDGATGFASAPIRWVEETDANSLLRVTAQFILKATGTGNYVRLAAKFKFQGTGEDSSSAYSPEGLVAVPVNHDTLGEVFEGQIVLSGADIGLHDACAFQVGRDGNNEMGAVDDDDDVNVPIQIIAVELEVS
jgi:hypothetical protein